ncbi:MAG: serine/threonine protein kinase [Sandaracinaceae bacterium]|nr:serine/threonine protein kinase [Sandaracinaceae bacterium]
MSFPPRIGRYHVVGRLATGGMAEILLGKVLGPSGFERPVVIKRILPSLARKREFVEMFLDEARVVARLRHPNVVHVQELAEEAGELFLVMEYLEGESAVSLMRRSIRDEAPLGPMLGAYIVMQACAGLHAAHELTGDDGQPLHVVHRDVTPSNVFVTYDGGVKLIDFGVAKFKERSTETEAGQMKGKFAYMSPEQCLGREVDRRADVFALGVVLFELTTGRRLFARPTSLLSMRAITEDRIPRPSEGAKGDYPASLDRIVEKSLTRDPAGRYPTAAAMRADLAEALRAMDAPALLEEQLAAVMAARFPERLEEKRELLRRVQAGSEITQMPSLEVDISVDVPDVERGTPMAVVEPSGPARRPPRLVYVAAAALALAAGAGLVLGIAARGPEASSEEGAAHAAAPAPPIEAPPDESARPAAPPTEPSVAEAAQVRVRLAVVSTPAGATVRVGGEERGVTPIDLSVPRADEVVRVEVTRAGFATRTLEVVPAQDQELRVELVADARRPGRGRRGAASSATPEEAPREVGGSPFRRFQ